MTIKDFLMKLSGENNERNDIPDDVTRDKVLRGLRRQRRVQMEEVEKAQLKLSIANFNRKRDSEQLFGTQIGTKKPKFKGKKEVNILKAQGQQLGKDKTLKKGKSMLSKGNFF